MLAKARFGGLLFFRDGCGRDDFVLRSASLAHVNAKARKSL